MRKDSLAHQLSDVSNPLVAGLELLERNVRRGVGCIELLRATARVPLRLELRKLTLDFFKAHAVRALVGPSIGRKLQLTVGHDRRNDFGEVANAIVVRGLADV